MPALRQTPDALRKRLRQHAAFALKPAVPRQRLIEQVRRVQATVAIAGTVATGRFPTLAQGMWFAS